MVAKLKCGRKDSRSVLEFNMSTSTSKQARWVSSQGPASPDQGGRKGDTTFGTVMKYVMNELRGSLVSVEVWLL